MVSCGAGSWNAVIEVRDQGFDKFVASLGPATREGKKVRRHGIHYSLVVHASSDLRMRASVVQRRFRPGDNMLLRGTLMQGGRPIRPGAQIDVHIQHPDGTDETVRLPHLGNGVFELAHPMNAAGVYTCRFTAIGLTREGHGFTREQVRTGACYYEPAMPPSGLVGRVPPNT
jgi:hypothetical protein